MTDTDKTDTRTDQTVRWVVFHAGELTGVLGPLVLAATVTEWFAAVSAAAAILWTAHEVHVARTRRAALGSGRHNPALITRTTTDTATDTPNSTEASA